MNEQGQNLLHLAVHLRYQTLVQKLVHWGIDVNVKDVNGSTALHAAYLCGDPFAVSLLEQAGAERFVPDELGRIPPELTPSAANINGDVAMKKEEIVPQALDNSVQVEEQRLSPNIVTPTQTQRVMVQSVVKEDYSVE